MSTSSAVDPGVPTRAPAVISARSALLTTLLEFAQPREEPVWTTTLVEGLRLLGIEEKAVRQALMRVSGEGHIASERLGRRTRWTLTVEGRNLLAYNSQRVFEISRESPRWDGTWLVLATTIPESQRQLRHHLRTRLHALGLGSAAPGLWISPSPDVIRDVGRVIDDLDLRDKASSWVGPLGPFGNPTALVAAAWDLTEVKRAHEAFVETFAGQSPATNPEVFAAQVRLVHAWRRVVLADPRLPLELLDPRWPGTLAATTFHHLHDAWARRAQEQWEALRALGEPTR